MSTFRFVFVCLLAGGLLVGCASGVPTPAPSSVPTGAPTPGPTTAPSLDPSLSDAGVVGRATVSGDERANRSGTYGIVGVAADGSSCETSFEGDEFIASAADESAADGQIHLMFVAFPVEDLPEADGSVTAAIGEGRAGFDFVSENFVGTLYVGEPQEDERTTISIDVTRNGSDLIFNFTGTTWDEVAIGGQLICADAA